MAMKAKFRLVILNTWKYSEQIHAYPKPQRPVDVLQKVKGYLHGIDTQKESACVRQMLSEMAEFL